MIFHLILLNLLSPSTLATPMSFLDPAEKCTIRNAESLRSPVLPVALGTQILELGEPSGARHVLEVSRDVSPSGAFRIRLAPLNGEGVRLYDWTLTGGSSSFRSVGFDLEECRPVGDQTPASSCVFTRDPGLARAEAHFWLPRQGGAQGTLWRIECAPVARIPE